ncbi:hypothetical protein A2631_00570 [Candidatus Daviesbacteria bacterium RIFCSPHIGHO2_01_FULL_44_29]|uniref:S1 motif domain-containing protein n=1 Tax=Candidatus Daviesbacteria bacterium RIFCSPHIGHO2_02_FULL_43_12 TaxID=1797776 RepID=A0A1F5KIA3_9BACT|nr:MAG: hypothetical protein A2631_00570 [Candidatus Daviesbacteria bacterium RIFCSPHIGHO2_01_FULL_44_29]OGE39442.1 MAG: hypothetical protein A3E86_01490 [Candidatus Daviesbacteria bacterium RIFCSPHIGHO2_12_FULL_47_45]OGE40341.1 MAG: hypothetical protein A3D25_03090 [Candidatus Daviesbacteria bacterium RIFCSPHIGHO2_02_FULL_43_12]OGE69740.1 MAG: hypothetical protein A3B55_02115 [Candidatus Daviesbacteria bacterium RIFCSPLOWO2_01_FULL_43_15]
MSMADLMAKQDQKNIRIERGQQVKGTVISILPSEIILDLGTKAEGVLPKRELSQLTIEGIEVGQEIETFVVASETPSGQVLLSLSRSSKGAASNPKWNKFLDGLKTGQLFNGKGVEINKGGLVVEVSGLRGFVPSSQVSFSGISKIEDLVGKELSLKVIEADPAQNRLIFAQKVVVSEEAQALLKEMKVGDSVKGVVSAVLPFAVAMKLENGLDGMIHVSELAWEKTEDPTKTYTDGQELEAKVLQVDLEAGKVELSLKSLQEDPFVKLGEKYQADDVVKGTVTAVSGDGVTIQLEPGVEAIMSSDVLEAGKEYQIGEALTVLIDKVDGTRRRITVSPMLTTTAGLIYK